LQSIQTRRNIYVYVYQRMANIRISRILYVYMILTTVGLGHSVFTSLYLAGHHFK